VPQASCWWALRHDGVSLYRLLWTCRSRVSSSTIQVMVSGTRIASGSLVAAVRDLRSHEHVFIGGQACRLGSIAYLFDPVLVGEVSGSDR